MKLKTIYTTAKKDGTSFAELLTIAKTKPGTIFTIKISEEFIGMYYYNNQDGYMISICKIGEQSIENIKNTSKKELLDGLAGKLKKYGFDEKIANSNINFNDDDDDESNEDEFESQNQFVGLDKKIQKKRDIDSKIASFKQKYEELFNSDQMEQINYGLENGLNVSIYAKPEFDDYQMREIRLGLEAGLDTFIYAKPEFVRFQMEEIRLGLEAGVNVSIYVKLEFSLNQIEQIRLGLEAGIDVSIYAKSEFNWKEMEEIRLGLEAKLKDFI